MYEKIKNIVSDRFYYLFLLIIAYHLIIRFTLIFSYSVDLDGTEFAFLHNAQLLYNGVAIYRDPDAFPFYAVMYTPLYPHILVNIAKNFVINPVYEVHRLLIFARALNLGMMIVCLRLLYKMMSGFNLPKNYVYLLLMLFVFLITGHFYAARPDGIKITLFIAQIYAVLQYFYFDRPKRKYLVLIVLFNVLSFLLKQDSVFYSYLLLLMLVLSKRNKQSIFLFLTCGVFIILSYCWCAAIFGKSFFPNTFIYNFQSITDFKNSYNIIVIYASLMRISVLLLLCIYGAWDFRKKHTSPDSIEFLLGCSAIPLFFISHIFMLKSGAYINYSFELIVILILLAAKLLSGYLTNERLKKRIKVIFFFYFWFLITSNNLLSNYTLAKEKAHDYKAEYIEHFQTASEIKKIIKDDTFLLPNASNLVYFADRKNIFYGYDAHIDRFINLYLHLEIKSALLLASPKKVDDSFKNGSVKYIVIEDDQRSAEHIRKYYPDYNAFAHVNKFIIYKFNMRP